MNLIFDLDGTLIDARNRLYRLFQELVPQSDLTYDRYWTFKQNDISNQTILATEFGFDAAAIESFVADWMDRIEASEFLALDKNLPRIHEALGNLRKQAKLHLCTARRAKQPVYNQLKHLGLLPFFETIMITEQCRTKEDLIIKIPDLNSCDWIIGDTGQDIQVGKFLGLRTCAVLTGFRNQHVLMGYQPDLILATAADFSLEKST